MNNKRIFGLVLLLVVIMFFPIGHIYAQEDLDGYGHFKKEYPSLNIKTNMLYWAALAPNIGLEYRFRNRWSVGATASVAWWKKQSTHKYYQIGVYEIEGRYYLGQRERHHLGCYIQGGIYDLGFNAIGRLGEFIGMGISYGYLLPISDSISLEFQIGLGYIGTSYQEYQYVEIAHIYEYLRTKRDDLFLPSKVGVSLIWNLPLFKMKGGSR